VANRQQAQLENLIGFFVNTLVLRTDLSGNPSFAEVLHRVRKVCLGAYAHQDVPFEQVVEALEPERDLSRSPLFQVLFALQYTSPEQGELADIQVSPLEVEHAVSKFDLTLSLAETKHGLHATLQYNSDLFEAQTIQRLLGHWQTLLEGVRRDPQRPIAQLPLLTEVEQEQLANLWQGRQADALLQRWGCISSLSNRLNGLRRPLRWSLKSSSSPMASSIDGLISWPITCTSWEWVLRWWLVCVWNAPWSW
jgi:non-ribosomal peptide synthetase component F